MDNKVKICEITLKSFRGDRDGQEGLFYEAQTTGAYSDIFMCLANFIENLAEKRKETTGQIMEKIIEGCAYFKFARMKGERIIDKCEHTTLDVETLAAILKIMEEKDGGKDD